MNYIYSYSGERLEVGKLGLIRYFLKLIGGGGGENRWLVTSVITEKISEVVRNAL